jgi:hypothetical protein
MTAPYELEPRTRATFGSRLNRRQMLQALGLGGAAAVGFGATSLMPIRGVAARQDLTVAPPTEEATATPPPSLPTVGDKAAALQYDLERIFRFVADEVRYEAYAGVLRGAKGALWGLAANSADQTLLLAALLDASLVQTRFVVGELDEPTAAKLLDAMRLDEQTAVLDATRAHVAALPDAGTDELTPEVQAALDRLTAAHKQLTAAAEQRLTDGLDVISGALDSISLTLPDAPFALTDLEQRRHVWLQYADGPHWIDLDPSVPDAEPGKAYATATETLEELPADWFHAVRFRVSVEESSGETVAPRELLRHEVLSQDLVGTPIAFAHVPPDAFEGAGLAIVEAITGTATLYPSLLIGPNVVVDQPIRVGSTGGMVDVLGETTTDGDALAEWLEFDILAPGAEPVTVSRTLFDRVGAEKRAAGEVAVADVPEAELVDLAEVGPTYPPLLGLTLLSVTGGRVPAALAIGQDSAGEDLIAHLAHLGLGYQFLLDTLGAAAVVPRGARLYPNAPNILALTVAVTDAEGGDPDLALGADLVHRAFAFAPVADRPLAAPAGMLAGVVSHVAERALLDPSWAVDLGGTSLPIADRSVGRVFEEAARQGIAILTIRPEDASGGARPADLTPEADLLLDQALDAGWIVIVPERPVDLDGTPAIGWWLVDPATGAVRDQFETGQETTLVEYAERVATFLYGPLPKFRTLGCLVAFIGLASSVLVYAGTVANAYDVSQNPSATTAGRVAAVLGMAGGTGGFAGGLLAPLAGCA